jgi:hypothetical protein
MLSMIGNVVGIIALIAGLIYAARSLTAAFSANTAASNAQRSGRVECVQRLCLALSKVAGQCSVFVFSRNG